MRMLCIEELHVTEQCPRCLNSSFKLLSNGKCAFCIGHWVSTTGGPYFRSVQMRFEQNLEEPTVLNSRDCTTSGVIGQP